MPGMFCRHNRLTSKCAICSRELDDDLRKKAPARPARERSTSARPATTTRSTARSSNRIVTRKLARAADDGYRNPLVPGLRAMADAQRLAVALTDAHAQLDPPGPHPVLAEVPDLEQVTWLAFLLALAGPEAPELQRSLIAATPAWEAADVSLPPDARGSWPEASSPLRSRTVAAYRAWVGRAGSQVAAFTGEESWTPQRRFGRVFERLALPGFTRPARYGLLIALGAAERYPLEADGLHLVEDDATTLAAKRLLVSGDRMLLERRAEDLAEACELPIAALDRGLAVWGTHSEDVDLTAEPSPAVAAALALR